jgi:hypothetical protein
MAISEKDFLMLCAVVRQDLKEQSRMMESYDSSIDRMSLSKELTRTDTEAGCLEAQGQNKTEQEETQISPTGRFMAYLHQRTSIDESWE